MAESESGNSGASPPDASNGNNASIGSGDEQSELEYKTKLLEFTYSELIDATKHQDDKIGRLLTVIAFLTAGALALANLAGGARVTAEFEVAPFRAPIGIICLTAFLLAIFVTVVLLVTSLATPLRMPGREPTKDRTQENRIAWAGGIAASQIYFSEIAKVSVRDWEEKWNSSKEELEKERLQMFVGETHNLSVRTSFKYDRTTEAIAVFSLSLLAFALAVIFGCLSAISASEGTRDDPIQVDASGRWLLAFVLGLYLFIHLLGRTRYQYQAIDETVPGENDPGLKMRVMGDRIFTFLFPFMIGLIVAVKQSVTNTWIWPTAIVLLTICIFIALVMRGWKDPKRKKDKKWIVATSWVLVAIALIGISVGALVGLIGRKYGLQLATSVLAVSVLTLLSATKPAILLYRSRRKFKESELERRQKGSNTTPSP